MVTPTSNSGRGLKPRHTQGESVLVEVTPISTGWRLVKCSHEETSISPMRITTHLLRHLVSAGLGQAALFARYFSFFEGRRPKIKADTSPTKVIPPILVAVPWAPTIKAYTHTPSAASPIENPKICPLLISALFISKALISRAWICFALASAIAKIRFAAPLTIFSYPSRIEG